MHIGKIVKTPANGKTMEAIIPLGVVQVKAKHLSTKVKEELPLATQRIDLSWHVVCNQYEHEELARYSAIKPHEYNDHRHKLFDDLKWHNHTRWRGGWGPEPMYYDNEYDLAREGRLCIIYATDKRAQEIRDWIQAQMFNLAPGND